MATHQVEEEDKRNDAQVNTVRHCSDSEEEEEFEDQNWDDWKDEDDAVGEQGLNPQLLCLFCDSPYGSCSDLFEHCASAHFFDFYGIKKAYNLDFYKCFKLINYVRSQVAVNKCWSCGKICMSEDELQKHLHKAVNFDGSSFPWDNDSYLSPFLQDDSLLYSFGEDDEDEEGDAMSVDTKELASYFSQFEHIDIHDEGASDRCASELIIPCENGRKDAVLSFDKDMNTVMPLESPIINDSSSVAGGSLSCRNRKSEMYTVPSTQIAANVIKNINKNYFGSYSSFGIHRDMISDKVRTDAYRQAILENPSLLRNAVIMDVGCGTGILSPSRSFKSYCS